MMHKFLIAVFLIVPGILHSQQPYDIIITEIFPDPTPRVLLPEEEFIEIRNISDQTISLEGWTIHVNDKQAVINNGTIEPKEYVVLCHKNDTSLFTRYGKVIGIAKMPALLNSGAVIILKNRQGRTIHTIDYSPELFATEYKSEGGWTLELADESLACIRENNWKECIHFMGGTPGAENSVAEQYDNYTKPTILNIGMNPDTSISVYFNQTMDSTDVTNKKNYTINSLDFELKAIPPFFDELQIRLNNQLQPEHIYTIGFNNPLKNCTGNEVENISELTFALPELPDEKDVIINEILFDPIDEKAEFVEFLNRSDKYILLNSLWLGKKDPDDLVLEDSTQVYSLPWLFKPGDIYAITKDKSRLVELYNCQKPGNIIENESLFNLNNTGKYLILADTNNLIIDHVFYSPGLHHSLITNTEEISLERINIDNENALCSASSVSGNATPGYENSQPLEVSDDIRIELSTKMLTPNSDGFDDELYVCFSGVNAGNTATATVFDSHGRKIKDIISNSVISENDCVFWNGSDKNDKPVETGLYILFVQVISEKGGKKIFKEGFAVNNTD